MKHILYGKQVAAALRSKLEEKINEYEHFGVHYGLAIILVDGDHASSVYSNALVRLAESMGLTATIRNLPADVSQQELLLLIDELNADRSISGILPMMPLPRHLNSKEVAKRILPEKDVDSIHPLNAGLVATGKSRWAPCTPRAVMAILDYYKISVAGKNVVIVGRSNVVGKPLFHLMLARDATVTVCHSRTADLAQVVKQADIVVAAVGRPKFIGAAMIKDGAVVIDVGINEYDGEIVGDVDYEAVRHKASAITPVPGGVGTVSNIMVMEAVLRDFA